VSGLIADHLRRIPAAGDRVVIDGTVFEVLTLRGRTAGRVRLRTKAPAPPQR
jgi:CBS domain containing-hemolysin-like protein